MNKLLVRLLPDKVEWITNLNKLSSTCSQRLLVALEKHGNDLVILHGILSPKNEYTEFDIQVDYYGHGQFKTIPKEEVLAVSLLPSFYISRHF